MLLNLFSSNKKTILFYGSKGWIGGLFMKYIVENYYEIKVIQGSARIDVPSEIIKEIDSHRPTHIVSFTGRTHGNIDGKYINTIDYLEYPGKLVENIRDNLYGPLTLADICTRKGIHYTYLGTGCIFNSRGLETENPEQFSESSLPNYFGSSYSIVKGFTDRLIKNYKVLNLRIRMPIHSVPNERNFISKILNYTKICSMPNSMTVLDDFFPVFMDLILNKKTGTYNCTNPGIISHDEILSMYRDTIDPNFEWKNFTLEEQLKVLKADRSNNALDTFKIETEFPDVPSIHSSMLNIIKSFKKNNK